MLQPVDRDAVLSELIGLQLAFVSSGKEPPDFTWRQLKQRVKRLRALLPSDSDLAKNVSPLLAERLSAFLDELSEQNRLSDEAGEIPFPADKRHYAMLQRFIREVAPSPKIERTPVARDARGAADGDGLPDRKAVKASDEAELSGEEKALALLVAHPKWTDTKIAKATGCARQTLYKWDRFTAARETLKSGRDKLPRGEKDHETGKIEAWKP